LGTSLVTLLLLHQAHTQIHQTAYCCGSNDDNQTKNIISALCRHVIHNVALIYACTVCSKQKDARLAWQTTKNKTVGSSKSGSLTTVTSYADKLAVLAVQHQPHIPPLSAVA